MTFPARRKSGNTLPKSSAGTLAPISLAKTVFSSREILFCRVAGLWRIKRCIIASREKKLRVYLDELY